MGQSEILLVFSAVLQRNQYMKANVEFNSNLYIGESIDRRKLDKIKKKLVSKPLLSNIYLITLAQNPNDQLDIFSARLLAQSYYQTITTKVIGIADGYDDAVKLLERIVNECLDARGDCFLREYLSC